MNDMTFIIPFLLRAKAATYAGKGPEGKSSRPLSHDLSYAEGEIAYLDTYLGGSHFAGEEAVWHWGEPVWSMNYVGRVTGEPFSGDFLKAALRHGTPDMPYRGPAQYREGDYEYRCAVKGDFAWFEGREAIAYQGRIIYECRFHGGCIR